MTSPGYVDAGETVHWRGGRAGRLVVVPLVLVAVGWLIAVGILAVPAWILVGHTVGLAVGGVVSLVAAFAAVTQVQTTRNAEYVLTDRALYVRDGAWFTEPRRVDHALIRDVWIEETPFEQLLGLGVVVAETETDEVWLYGLEQPGRAAERIDEAALSGNGD